MASAARISWPGIRRRSGRSTWRPEADRENGSSPLRTAVKHLALSVFAAARSGTSTFCRRPQGLGYGRLLLDFAVRQAPGDPTLWLLENNSAAQRFYEDAGFTFTGRENRSGKLAEREMTLQA